MDASIEHMKELREVVQKVQLVAVGLDHDGNEIEVVLTSTRRPCPVPYTEEP